MVLAQLLVASALSLSQGDAAPQTIETGAAVFGVTSCWTGDWNGDGRRDIAVAEPWRSDTPDFLGRVEVFCGVTGAVLHTFEGAKNTPQLGRALVGVPDVDGDGIDDVLAAALGTLPVDKREPRALFEPEARAFELVLLGSRGKVVQTIVYPESQATAVEMRATALPGAPSGTPNSFGLLMVVRRKDKTASASWGVPFAGERYSPKWVLELGGPYYVGTISGHMPLELIDGARCLLTVIGPDGPRAIAVERDTGKEVLRLEPPRQGKHLRAVAYLHVEGDTAGRIVVSVPDGCNGGHRAALQPVVPGQDSNTGAHDTVLWYRADDGKLVARMCEAEFAAHAHRLDRRNSRDQSHYFGTALQALPRRTEGERASDLLVIADARFSDGIALVMEPEELRPLAIAPASTDYDGWFDDWGRAWSLAVEPTDGSEPPRLLLGTKTPYGGTHSGVLICSSATGDLLLRVVRAAPILTPAPSGG